MSTLPEKDHSVPSTGQGAFRKYNVSRVDGSDAPGGKHHGERYFVLAVDSDPFAVPAITAYAAACEATHLELADELREKWGAKTNTQPDEDELEDMARSAFEVAMSFGVSVDAFLRLARDVAHRCQKG